jgi:hypothetical protein
VIELEDGRDNHKFCEYDCQGCDLLWPDYIEKDLDDNTKPTRVKIGYPHVKDRLLERCPDASSDLLVNSFRRSFRQKLVQSIRKKRENQNGNGARYYFDPETELRYVLELIDKEWIMKTVEYDWNLLSSNMKSKVKY